MHCQPVPGQGSVSEQYCKWWQGLSMQWLTMRAWLAGTGGQQHSAARRHGAWRPAIGLPKSTQWDPSRAAAAHQAAALAIEGAASHCVGGLSDVQRVAGAGEAFGATRAVGAGAVEDLCRGMGRLGGAPVSAEPAGMGSHAPLEQPAMLPHPGRCRAPPAGPATPAAGAVGTAWASWCLQSMGWHRWVQGRVGEVAAVAAPLSGGKAICGLGPCQAPNPTPAGPNTPVHWRTEDEKARRWRSVWPEIVQEGWALARSDGWFLVLRKR